MATPAFVRRIEGTQKPGGAPLALKDLPWKKIAGNGPFWALLVSHMTWAVGHYVILAWLPTFYSQQYGLNTADSAAYSILPWVCTFFCTNLGGWTADALINRGVLDVTQVSTEVAERGCPSPPGLPHRAARASWEAPLCLPAPFSYSARLRRSFRPSLSPLLSHTARPSPPTSRRRASS